MSEQIGESTQDIGDVSDTEEALRIAGAMIDAGIPIFAAPPCPAASGGTCARPGHTGREEYDLPNHWQKTVPSRMWIERWKPGWALAAVGGHAADFIDNDPRNGGDASMAELEAASHMPRVYGVAETPSGGQHFTIAPLGERKGELMPGVDYQGGTPDGEGLGFVWLAPTVRRSKHMDHLGERRPYRWLQPPDLEWLAEGGDESGAMLRSRLVAARARKNEPRGPDNREGRLFTEAEARAFCTPLLDRLKQAKIGQIEERANTAAAQLSHFVPEIWDTEFAFNVLMGALSETAYDPNRPEAGWVADKFRKVLSGENGRAPSDWKAQPRRTAEQAVEAVQPDAVAALLAEMRHPEQLADMPPPRHLVRGLLTLDSESWMIGPPGSKKSFVALDIAGHVARGQDWQGLRVTQGRVVMIVAEGAAGTGKRIKAWQTEYGQMDPHHDQVWILPRPVQARDAGAWATLVKACEEIKPALVIIDTQARVTVGLKENDATDMGIYIDAQRTIKEKTQACVLTIHHTGRQGGDARGSSALDGAQGTEIKIMPEAGSKLRAVLHSDKQKDIEEEPPMPLYFKRVELGQDEDGAPVSSLVLVSEDAWRAAEVSPLASDPDEGYQQGEIGQWAYALTKPNAKLLRIVLQVLYDLAGEHGRTEAKIRKATEAVRGKFRDEAEWSRLWRKAVELTLPGRPEERAVQRVRGESFALHSELLADVTDE